ncbi:MULTISPECIES: hypothetical protein [Nocardioides]|uniref:Type II toxin-antitoxin system PemK/MazF family toxin n=1 Tax=Nocardioides vastitatis TaxID=2568655 RepID=A0ABW0ZI11_9ACTN|nr:hypothetical protein [Nocardioides sp.]THJ09198.1 hypothetical protein E7Z54_03425 [Nocardioides sp.]
MIRLTDRAHSALREDEVVLVDWHRAGLCCSDAGEISVRAIRAGRLPRSARSATRASGRVFAHPLALSQLLGRDVLIDCRLIGRWRRFSTDLPPDAGLRACLGRLPDPVATDRTQPSRSP